MNSTQIPQATAVDVVFPVDGNSLARDHAQALQEALCRQWPWLESEVQTGIHTIKLVPGTQAQAMLSRRTKLLLRVPTHRTPELLASAGVDLVVTDQPMRLGTPHTRELFPHATLYAYNVAATNADEVAFMADVTRELAELGIGGERVCGKRQQLTLNGGVLNTFSLMLHALAPEHSLRVQCLGLGPHRLLGCGIFIPHKSAAAV
ncbi:MAG: type I-MYXAN CRISPR-associated protein Cas6/Cmx6 [Rhodoferax sp.]|uniref:type I-MYXAN CRISPR-associated protein Cas6/Cmx6 n=1 Tax=Rhodoferax sp. TaxID=50421 RepID=UPI00262F069B|nr:type I-MYXAN CRISPR-associated protein Cas6/Cmx6 [Rhodoferax sp.]MDD2880220.1 type I-MYXAN CRISPR-associated protein Cas6/Cmx6 [Rhodoferax sp.]